MSNQQDLLQRFINITSASEVKARSALESNEWDLQTAVAQYCAKPETSTQNEKESLVQDILKQAADGRSEAARKPFSGTGYTLDKPTNKEPETVTRRLIFWRNGFSVDDGPLHEYADPANQEMLTAIKSGRAPLSLLGVQHGQPVEVKVIKRRKEDYVQPATAFEGKGNRLGSSITYSSPLLAKKSSITVDETQPTTNIQIRLADGSRLVGKFNYTHTIGDIRTWINENDKSTDKAYKLQTTFPVKDLDDDKETIKEANLLNSIIIQQQ